ncbi:hypothetical protein [Natrialbaceae archaeon AArc-T1-2]|uniref:hypothetical protein n=1 Tax=Natrialbaceae archaeon AArc-T1-2 TaxID=3053904 RepID=UPI00255A8665|nr:hypothetical protein [Natrialbaceae archaeon AArc-T1-2]WIV68151.1 hypothetical protein QQ977_05330 [Natrialbaceae archaeon AArc-T1-2]
MDFGQALKLLIAAVVLAIAFSVATTSLLAAACLVQYSILVMLEHDSDTFQSVAEERRTELTIVKVALLLIAAVLIL